MFLRSGNFHVISSLIMKRLCVFYHQHHLSLSLSFTHILACHTHIPRRSVKYVWNFPKCSFEINFKILDYCTRYLSWLYPIYIKSVTISIFVIISRVCVFSLPYLSLALFGSQIYLKSNLAKASNSFKRALAMYVHRSGAHVGGLSH
jgi:hypothetical protein